MKYFTCILFMLLTLETAFAQTWTHGTATDYDGAFTLDTSLRLAYGNEYPFWIKNIRFFDGWVKDGNLDQPNKAGSFPALPIWSDEVGPKPYEY